MAEGDELTGFVTDQPPAMPYGGTAPSALK
ncbi:hypothetical protein RKD20_002480 [Streptomyces sp. SLBN-8D4]